MSMAVQYHVHTTCATRTVHMYMCMRMHMCMCMCMYFTPECEPICERAFHTTHKQNSFSVIILTSS